MNLNTALAVISILSRLVSTKIYITLDAAFLSSSLDITGLKTGVDQVLQLGSQY